MYNTIEIEIIESVALTDIEEQNSFRKLSDSFIQTMSSYFSVQYDAIMADDGFAERDSGSAIEETIDEYIVNRFINDENIIKL